MGFTFMEAFMDEVTVDSEVESRNFCPHEKDDPKIRRGNEAVLLPESGLRTRGIKRQEIQFLRRIQDLSTVWQKDF